MQEEQCETQEEQSDTEAGQHDAEAEQRGAAAEQCDSEAAQDNTATEEHDAEVEQRDAEAGQHVAKEQRDAGKRAAVPVPPRGGAVQQGGERQVAAILRKLGEPGRASPAATSRSVKGRAFPPHPHNLRTHRVESLRVDAAWVAATSGRDVPVRQRRRLPPLWSA